MIGWIAFGILVLIAILPVGICGVYDAGGPLLQLMIGPVRIRLYPGQSKGKPKSRKADKTRKPSAQGQSRPNKSNKGGSLSEFKPILSLVLELLGALRRKLRVRLLEFKLVLAGDDPCDLAVNYGKAWAAVGNLMPQLERVFVIQKRNIEVECDFTADQTRVLARLDLTITLGRILGLVFALIGRALVELIKIVMKRKGGAVNEPKSS
jgi:hypothetical protein